MINQKVLLLFFNLIILNLLSKNTITATKVPLLSLNNKPIITQILVFSPSSETVISFDPKHGWILGEEKHLHLYISGLNLINNAIVFTSSPNECTTSEFLSPIYNLSSTPITELDIKLKPVSQTYSSMFICLLPSTRSENGTLLDGPYFLFVREKGRLPYAAKICLILMLFIVSGFYSGLNLGLMSLSVNDLILISESEDSSMRFYAKRVLPLRRRGNFLLCSIVLSNVLVNSLGTVLLDSLVHGIYAVLGSTAMIVIMGEIIPQAICSRYGLVIGARTHVITWMSMIITGVISFPLGFILDKILGQEVTASYTRDQIAGMLTRIKADIEKPELDVITGVLSLRKKTVKDAMTLLPDAYMLDQDRKSDAELLLDVHKHGFSRIPVYTNDRSNIVGIVKLRDFALITPEQYHLTVKHVLEFHTHPFGYTKTTDSLYNLMQEFLKARWHMALVQELQTEEDNIDPVYKTVGIITLEDVIEEMLQREIIEEADFFTDNRSKIRRKRTKATDYTALVKRPVKDVQQFSSGFISQDILKVLLNYNVYATIKRPANQRTNSIYLYKKSFRYELFTLITQGNATLESGSERIISTVGPFSYFATSALLAEDKTVKDVHDFLENLSTKPSMKSNEINHLLDEISSIFISDYNLIVNSELQILQIHRLVWLAAVRATQKQRSKDKRLRDMQPEQLLSNAFDEISSITSIPMDKNNLTNFQRIFHNEKEIKHVTQISTDNSVIHSQPTSPSVFHAINQMNSNRSNEKSRKDSGSNVRTTTAIACNPLLLTLPSDEQTYGNLSNNTFSKISSASTVLSEDGSYSNMNIKKIFEDTHDHTFDHDHGQEKEHLIDEGQDRNNIWLRQPLLPSKLTHAHSDTNYITQSSIHI